MRYTEKQLVSACMTYRHDFALLPPEQQDNVRGQMAQVLGHLPEPEPQPGLMPERDTVARAMHGAYWSLAEPGTDCASRWATLSEVGRGFYLAEADKARELCAGKLPAEVWSVLQEMRACSSDGVELYAVTEYANKLEAALKGRPVSWRGVGPKLTALVNDYFRNRDDRPSNETVLLQSVAQSIVDAVREDDALKAAPGADRVAELEAEVGELRKSLACSRDRMRVTAERLERADECIADLEAKLATTEQERVDLVGELHANAEKHARELAARPEPVVIDEALAEGVLYDIGITPQGDYLVPALVTSLRKTFGTHASVSVPQGEPRLGITVREAARRRNPIDGTDAQALEHAITITERERDQLRAELDECRGRLELMTMDWQGRKADCDVLRAELEKTRRESATHHASWVVAVNTLYEVNVALGKPAPDKTDNPVQLAAKVRAELEKARAELQVERDLTQGKDDALAELRAELADLELMHQTTLDYVMEMDGELEKTRAELEAQLDAKHAKLVDVADRFRALRRAAQTVADNPYLADPDMQRLRALLQPATPEAREERLRGLGYEAPDERAYTVGDAIGLRRIEAVQHTPHEAAMETTLEERVERLERLAVATAHVSRSLSWGRNGQLHSSYVQAMSEALEALDARSKT
jgi:septal ring factor EnvC (AmiA/AmiB activator)